MICRNCKFSLQGSERFCPNCGAPLSEDNDEKLSRQIAPPPAPEIFFTPVRQNAAESGIFREMPAATCPAPQKAEKKRRAKAPIVLALVILLAVLITGAFAAAEHFNVAPVIMQYLNGTPANNNPGASEDTEEKTTLTDTGIIMPEISYTPTQAFVANRPSLSLRKGPSDSYGLIRGLNSGCQVQILGGSVTDEIWVYVYVPFYDCYGWLNSSFVTLYNSLETPEVMQTEESTQQ